LADVLGHNRLAVQIAGLALGIFGFAVLRWIVQANLAAQCSAALVGVALVLFAQFFGSLRRIAPQERRRLETAGVLCFAICLVAALAATGYHAAGSVRGGAPGKRSASARADISFDKDEPSRLVIRAPARRWQAVVIEVQKVWTLTPDKPAPDTIDWLHDPDLELPADKSPPYKVRTMAGNSLPITVTLQPALPNASVEEVQVTRGWARRIKLPKDAKDYVFLLRVELLDAQGNLVPAGNLLYLPDLKSGYSTPTTSANQEVLRELAAAEAPKSAKLNHLLSAHALLLGTQQ